MLSRHSAKILSTTVAIAKDMTLLVSGMANSISCATQITSQILAEIPAVEN